MTNNNPHQTETMNFRFSDLENLKQVIKITKMYNI